LAARHSPTRPLLLASTLLLLLFAACVTPTDLPPAEPATVVRVAPAFAIEPGLRVAVLPFVVTGHPERTRDITAADILGVKLAEAGFVLVDSTLFCCHDLNLEALLPTSDLAAIREELAVEVIAFGTVNYAYDSGSQSLLGKGRYYLDSASVRLVSLATGEVLVIATVRGIEGSPAAALGESIKRALAQR